MNSKNLKLPIYFLFLIGIIVACQKEIIEVSDDSEAYNIDDAKRWYESNAFKGLETKGGNMPIGRLRANPDWSRAICSKHKESKTVEVPLIFDQEIGITTEDSYETWKTSKNERLLNSKTLLVIETNNNNNKTGFLMTIVPDMEYRIANDYEAYNSSYKKWQKGFSGAILYHHYDGSFSNGWKFTNGTVTNKISYVGEIKLPIDLLPKGCTHYFWVTTITDCTYKKGTTGCYVVYQSWDYMYSICDYSSYTSGGGGYDPTQSSTPVIDPVYDMNSTLGPIQKILLEEAISEFVSKSSIYNGIWQSLINSGTKLKFKIGNTPTVDVNGVPTQVPACLSPDRSTITFRDENSINYYTVREELIHKFQANFYGSSFNSMIRNYEYEAKVLQDVITFKRGLGGPTIGSINLPSSMAAYYDSWIIQIASGAPVFFSIFNSFCSNWNYLYPPGNYFYPGFIPSALIECLSDNFGEPVGPITY